MTIAVFQHRWPNANVTRRTTEDLPGRLQRLTALQRLDDEWVPRRGQRSLAPVTRHKQLVGTRPGVVLLALRQAESTRDKRAAHEIELAHRHRILAALGQGHETTSLLRAQARGAMPEPVRFLRGSDRIEIEYGGPRRRRLLVVRQRGAAPDTAHMVGVLPEINQLAGDKIRRRQAVLAEYDRLRLGVQRCVARILLEDAQRLAILRPDPVHRSGPIDILEPQERVVLCGRQCAASGCAKRQQQNRPHGALSPSHQSLDSLQRHGDPPSRYIASNRFNVRFLRTRSGWKTCPLATM